jgi:hypothetical protein
MKIVDRKTFLAMPEGFVFQKFEPMIFGDIEVRNEAIQPRPEFPGDYYSTELTSRTDCDDDSVFSAIENGTSFDMSFITQCRDGFYDADEQFAVWERKDVEGLIARLQRSLEEAYPED